MMEKMKDRRLSLTLLAVALFACSAIAGPKSASDPARIHGSVVLKSLQHETVIVVRSGDTDGVADHVFHIWFESPSNLSGTYRGADVEFIGASLVLTIPSQQTVLTFTTALRPPDALVPQEFATTGYTVMGLNHEIGETASRHSIRSGRAVTGQSDCNDCDFNPFETPDPWNSTGGGSCFNGGPGSTSCSTSNSSGSCSVSCSGGFYACCTNPIMGAPSCTCVH
jgi:hypothetical protein